VSQSRLNDIFYVILYNLVIVLKFCLHHWETLMLYYV